MKKELFKQSFIKKIPSKIFHLNYFQFNKKKLIRNFSFPNQFNWMFLF